ncbi:hypothetical protein [Thalassovita taeanensis]|uniref:hypothetical protein n=1 Tax=Thalassovita taeanensis TaxID=657014 RepID=UPI001114AED7|nr:hypothetical protein [Thalassovita taeanensis]
MIAAILTGVAGNGNAIAACGQVLSKTRDMTDAKPHTALQLGRREKPAAADFCGGWLAFARQNDDKYL